MSLTSHGNELCKQEIIQKKRAHEWIAEYREIADKYLAVSQVNRSPTNLPSEVLFQGEKLLAMERDIKRCHELFCQIQTADCFELQVSNMAGKTRVFPRTYLLDEVEVLRLKCALWLGAQFGPAITFLRDGKVCSNEDLQDPLLFSLRLNDDTGFVGRRKIPIFGTVHLDAVNCAETLTQEKMLEWSAPDWFEVFKTSVTEGQPSFIGGLWSHVKPEHRGAVRQTVSGFLMKGELFLWLLLFAPSQTVRRNTVAEFMRGEPGVSLFGLTTSPREVREAVPGIFYSISNTWYGAATDTIMALQEASLLDLNYQCVEDRGKTVLHKMTSRNAKDFEFFFDAHLNGLKIILACGADKQLRTQDGHTAHYFLLDNFEKCNLFFNKNANASKKTVSKFRHALALLRV